MRTEHLPVVLHIAADYRCEHNPNGTTAIPELIECTNLFAEHIVVSLPERVNDFAARGGINLVCWAD